MWMLSECIRSLDLRHPTNRLTHYTPKLYPTRHNNYYFAIRIGSGMTVPSRYVRRPRRFSEACFRKASCFIAFCTQSIYSPKKSEAEFMRERDTHNISVRGKGTKQSDHITILELDFELGPVWPCCFQAPGNFSPVGDVLMASFTSES